MVGEQPKAPDPAASLTLVRGALAQLVGHSLRLGHRELPAHTTQSQLHLLGHRDHYEPRGKQRQSPKRGLRDSWSTASDVALPGTPPPK